MLLLAEKSFWSCVILSEAIERSTEKKPVVNLCIEINRLENEADKLERNLIAELLPPTKNFPSSSFEKKKSTNCWKQPPTGARTWPT